MGKPLKDQWGVSDPAKAGSDKQSQEFQATFAKELAPVNSNLQYTSANAEVAVHQPLESRRDGLYPVFQSALAQIDRTDPKKAQPAIDKVLADVKSLSAEVSKFRRDAEKAVNDWKTRQSRFDATVHQVEELEIWGEPKALALRTLVDGIRGNTNDRSFAKACATLDLLLPKLKPIHDDYLRQKEANPKYEQALAEKNAKFDTLKTAERPSQPITAKICEADSALQEAKIRADAKNFVGACEEMKIVQTAIEVLEKLLKDPQRVKFLADRKAVNDQVKNPEIAFKTLDADWTAITQDRDQSDPLADSGDYAGANKLLTGLRTKFTSFQKKYEDLKKKKTAFDDALAVLQPRLSGASQSQTATLEPMQTDIATVQGQMDAAVQADDYLTALKFVKDLTAKVDAYQAAKTELEKKYQDALQSAQKAIATLKGHAQKANFTAEITALEASLKDAQSKGDGNNLDDAIKLLKPLVSKCSQVKTSMDMVAKGLTKARADQVADVSQSLVDSGVDPDKAAEIGQVTHFGGSGDAADAKAVAKELAVLPTAALKTMNQNGTKVIACRGNVTDYLTQLKGVTPRGWPAGSKWDSVPGVFTGGSNEVVIATQGAGTPDGPKVPPTGNGHGAFDLAAHESTHGYDLGGTGPKKHSDPAFVTARTQDMAKLGSYFTQAGEAGLEETYAESAARYYGKDPKMKTDWPNLYNYWDSQPK